MKQDIYFVVENNETGNPRYLDGFTGPNIDHPVWVSNLTDVDPFVNEQTAAEQAKLAGHSDVRKVGMDDEGNNVLLGTFMKSTTPNADARQEDREVKAEPIKTTVGNLYPNMEIDTCAGEKMMAGSMFMQISAGECTLTHKGKKETINIGSGLDGSTILLAHGRYFVLDIKAYIQHAIDAGLLAETLDFNRAT